MAINLLSLLRNEFSGDAVGKIASLLGESPTATQSAIAGVLPAVLGALTQKASTPQGAADLFGLMQKGGFNGNALGSLASLLGGGGSGVADLLKAGAPLVGSLFGGRQSAVTDWLSSSAGISKNATSSLLSLAVPFVMNLLGKQATSGGGFNVSSLASLLGAQGSFLSSAAPSGLASALGVASFADLAGPALRSVPTAPSGDDAGGGLGFLKWAIPLFAVVALVAGLRTCRTEPAQVARTEPMAAPAGPAAADARPTMPAWPNLGAFVVRLLPGEVKLNVPELGIESKLIAFIADAGRPVDETTWFSFDRLEFETASAVLKPASEEQLKNIAAILKAYPAVKVKVGGYTDNVGDPASNLALSQARAENTVAALVQQGVARDRLAAEGYGEKHPVATNDTDEGRQRNRRIDVRVTAK